MDQINVFKVKATIKLYEGVEYRKTPFITGYRPVFNFIHEMKKSGQIILKDRQEFYPGEIGIVEIVFLNKDYLGENFGIGAKFHFGEGRGPIGEGEILEIF